MTQSNSKPNWCTFFPEKIYDVDISYACYRHDMAYLQRKISTKFRSDFELMVDVWDLAELANDPTRKVAMRITSVAMGITVATLGTPVWLCGWVKSKVYSLIDNEIGVL